jgi:hypothetical protein
MVKRLEESQWRPYFDRMSKALLGKRAEIEVASLKLGDQIEVEWLPLLGISYDPKDNVIQIALEGVEHLIYTSPARCTSRKKAWSYPASRLSMPKARARPSF